MLEKMCGKFFEKYDKVFKKRLFEVLNAMVESCSSNTRVIAQTMSKQNNKNFQTNEKALYRLLTDKTFQVDYSFWRCHIKMIFSFIKAKSLFQKEYQFSIDTTSKRDDFLILMASITSGKYVIPLFFTTRLYPKKANQINLKNMERAFLKGLRHLLPKKYEYVIVGDRGFGNKRIIETCKELRFDYILRISDTKNVMEDNRKLKLSEMSFERGEKEVMIMAWEQSVRIIRTEKDEKVRHLATSLSNESREEIINEYKKRFRIEKLFKELKSSGFNIEESKIKKYERYKRILSLSLIGYALTLIIGDCFEKEFPKLKKNSPLCISVLLAYSNLPERLYHIILKEL